MEYPKLVACPGAEHFTDKLMMRLHRHYEKTLKQQINPSDFLVNSLVQSKFTYFVNGEIKCKILESVRGKDVYIIQDVGNRQEIKFNNDTITTRLSINDHILSLFVAIDAIKHASPRRITLILPAFPYSRQHRKTGRESVLSSRLINLFASDGIKTIFTLDLHSEDIANFSNEVIIENVMPGYQAIKYFSSIIDLNNDDICFVASDIGSINKNKFYANILKKDFALIYKERNYTKVSTVNDSNITTMKLLGNIAGKTCIITDDMCDTGGTLLKASRLLKENGAKKVILFVSLPMFNNEADKIFDAEYKNKTFDKVIGTNAIYHTSLLKKEWYASINIAGVFADIIYKHHHNESLGDIIDGKEQILDDFPTT